MAIKIEAGDLRKIFCMAGATLVLASCSPQQPQATDKPPVVREAPPQPDQTQVFLTRTHQEVIRLLQDYPEDSITRKAYLGNLSEISPIFADALPVGIADPKEAYSRTHFAQAEYSPKHRFNYFSNHDQSLKGYATLQRQEVAVYFSPVWLDTKSDAVKKLVLEKEAYNLALYEPFSKIILNTYLTQGRIDKTDPQITEDEIARTLARQILFENAEVRKLYDYAAYLPLLSRVGKLLESQDPEIEKELNYSNLAEIYRLAKEKGIKFENLQGGSREFLQLALDINGPWAKMILDPSIAGPAPAY